jgi:hypothetical protein
MVQAKRPGEVVPLTVLRGGERRDFMLKVQ